MNQHDPTFVEDSSLPGLDREFTIEEVASVAPEPTGAAEAPEQAARQPVTPLGPGPIVPPIIKRPVSGRYRGSAIGFELELRIDVDRTKPLKRLSGDFFQVSGATKTYFGSFVAHNVSIAVTPTLVTIEGIGQYTWPAGAPKIKVTIPRVPIFAPPAPATLRFFTLANTPGAAYLCAFESIYFRTLVIETDRVSDVTSPVFATYDTSSLPSPGPNRTLSVAQSLVEAGVQVQISPNSNVINLGAAGPTWSNAELHASMVAHFSSWQDEPQFKVWEVVAQKHDLHNQGIGLLGIMFDQMGKQRQGCAVFHLLMAGTTASILRKQLYTYVHELGHCFNLMHSWQKSFAVPPGTNRPAALSWMNYPQNYPLGGETGFWNDFPFQFDTEELVHIRHAFRNHIIMGGNNFTVNAGLEDVERFNPPIEDYSGLRLEITAPRSFMVGEPVSIELKLHATDVRGKTVTPYLHPNMGLVDIAIRRPGGQITAYRPVIEHCVEPRLERLDAAHPIVETAYIGYGRDGLYFDSPGLYRIRAVYAAPDGSRIVSNQLDLRVRTPLTVEDEEIADLYTGDEQGMLFYLAGSDSDSLRRGNDALDLVLDKHGDHPLAVYARMAKAINLGRTFKTILPDREQVSVRRADESESAKMLASIAAAGGPAAEAKTIDATSYETMMAAVATSRSAEPGDNATTERRPSRRPGSRT